MNRPVSTIFCLLWLRRHETEFVAQVAGSAGENKCNQRMHHGVIRKPHNGLIIAASRPTWQCTIALGDIDGVAVREDVCCGILSHLSQKAVVAISARLRPNLAIIMSQDSWPNSSHGSMNVGSRGCLLWWRLHRQERSHNGLGSHPTIILLGASMGRQSTRFAAARVYSSRASAWVKGVLSYVRRKFKVCLLSAIERWQNVCQSIIDVLHLHFPVPLVSHLLQNDCLWLGQSCIWQHQVLKLGREI